MLLKIVSRAAEFLCKENQYGSWLDARTDATSIWALSNCGLGIKDPRFLRYCIMELIEDSITDESGLCWNNEIWDTSVSAIAIKNFSVSDYLSDLKKIKNWLFDEISESEDNFRNEPWESLWALFALLNLQRRKSKEFTKINKKCIEWLLSKRNKEDVLIAPHYTGLFLSVLNHVCDTNVLNNRERVFIRNIINQNILYLKKEFDDNSKNGNLWNNEPWSIGLILHGIATSYNRGGKHIFENKTFNKFLETWCVDNWDESNGWEDVTDTSGLLIGLSEYFITSKLKRKCNNKLLRTSILKDISSHIIFEFKEIKSRRLIVHPYWKERKFKIKNKLCCLIMPFTTSWSNNVREDINKILKAKRYELDRADDLINRDVIEGIWKLINEARIIIADCTGKNVNVFYELGIAHTIGKDVILIAQETEKDIPFDIGSQRILKYEKSNVYNSLKEKLPKLIDNIIAGKA